MSNSENNSDLFGNSIAHVKPTENKRKQHKPDKSTADISTTCKGCIFQWKCVWKTENIDHLHCPAYHHYLRITGAQEARKMWSNKVREVAYL